MQVFPLVLMALIELLPESPRYYVHRGKHEKAAQALRKIYPQDEFDGNGASGNIALSNGGNGDTTKKSTSNKAKLDELIQSANVEEPVSYTDMLFRPSHPQFHPTVVTVMGQVNQALTGYGAISVYGPQILELLGFSVMSAEIITQANYLSYLALMTFAWLLIDAVGRRNLMLVCSAGMVGCFFLMTICAGLSENSYSLNIPNDAVAIPGTVLLFIATGNFGIGWLSPVWLIPTEIYPTTARAQAAAISVIIWGLANFAVTLLTPILFNTLSYWIFAVFTITNAFAGWWTNRFLLESGGRSFEENQRFFEEAKKAETWDVRYVKDGEWLTMPKKALETEDGETEPLLGRVRRQV